MTNFQFRFWPETTADNLPNAMVKLRKVMEMQDALYRCDYIIVIAVCRSMLTMAERPPIRSIRII